MTGIGINESITYALLFIALYFEVFLLVTFLEKRGKKSVVNLSKSDSINLLRTSIVIPCFNEARTLASTIESVLALNYPRELLEVIVVDDGSTDRTLAIAKEFESKGVRVFHKENGGKHTALNLALAQTNAELIGCLDADSTVAPDALTRIVSAFGNLDISAVTPGIHVRKP